MATHEGAMIALLVPDPELYALPVQDDSSVPAHDLHITLGYLGKADEISPEERESILSACQVLADTSMAPQTLFPASSGIFPPDPEAGDESPAVPHYLAPSNPEVFNSLREDLLTHLSARGVAHLVSDKFPVFNPHVTLTYLPLGSAADLSHVPTPLPTQFTTLVVRFGDVSHTFELQSHTDGPPLPLTASVRAQISTLSHRVQKSEDYLTALYLRQRQVVSNPSQTRAQAAIAKVNELVDPSYRAKTFARIEALSKRINITPNPAAKALIANRALALAAQTVSTTPDEARRLDALTASLRTIVADGNSSAARSLRVRSQLRDRYGRWIEMGRGVRFKIRVPGAPGGGTWYHGTVQGMDTASGRVMVKLDDDGRVVKIPSNKLEQPKAILGLKGVTDRIKSFIPKSVGRSNPEIPQSLPQTDPDAPARDAAALDALSRIHDAVAPKASKEPTGGHLTPLAIAATNTPEYADAVSKNEDSMKYTGKIAPFAGVELDLSVDDLKAVREAYDARVNSMLPEQSEYDAMSPEDQKKALQRAQSAAIGNLSGMYNDRSDEEAYELRTAPSVGTDADLEEVTPEELEQANAAGAPDREKIAAAARDSYAELAKRVPDSSSLSGARDTINKSLEDAVGRYLDGGDEKEFLQNLDSIKEYANDQEPSFRPPNAAENPEENAFGEFAEDIDDIHASINGIDEIDAVRSALDDATNLIDSSGQDDGSLKSMVDDITKGIASGKYLNNTDALGRDMNDLADSLDASRDSSSSALNEVDEGLYDETLENIRESAAPFGDSGSADAPESEPTPTPTPEAPEAPDLDATEAYTDAPDGADEETVEAFDKFQDAVGAAYDLEMGEDGPIVSDKPETSEAAEKLHDAVDAWESEFADADEDGKEELTDEFFDAASQAAEAFASDPMFDSEKIQTLMDAATDLREAHGSSEGQDESPASGAPTLDTFSNIQKGFQEVFEEMEEDEEDTDLSDRIAAAGNAVGQVGKELQQGLLDNSEAVDLLGSVVRDLDELYNDSEFEDFADSDRGDVVDGLMSQVTKLQGDLTEKGFNPDSDSSEPAQPTPEPEPEADVDTSATDTPALRNFKNWASTRLNDLNQEPDFEEGEGAGWNPPNKALDDLKAFQDELDAISAENNEGSLTPEDVESRIRDAVATWLASDGFAELIGMDEGEGAIADPYDPTDVLNNEFPVEGDTDAPQTGGDPWAIVSDQYDTVAEDTDLVADHAPEVSPALENYKNSLISVPTGEDDDAQEEQVEEILDAGHKYLDALDASTPDADGEAVVEVQKDKVEPFLEELENTPISVPLDANTDPAKLQGIIDALNDQDGFIQKAIAQNLQSKLDNGEEITQKDLADIRQFVDFVSASETSSPEEKADLELTKDALDYDNAVPAIVESPIEEIVDEPEPEQEVGGPGDTGGDVPSGNGPISGPGGDGGGTGDGPGDGLDLVGGDGVTRTVYPVAVHDTPAERAAVLQALGLPTPQFHELDAAKDADVFRRAIASLKENNKYAAAVHVYDLEDYQGMRLFVTDDGTLGFALNGDDIISAFSLKGGKYKGGIRAGIALAVQNGGRRADSFDTVLPEIYTREGLEVVSRVSWDDNEAPSDWDKEVFAAWNNGEPDVVMYAYNAARLDTEYVPGEGQKYDTWGEAADVQAKALGIDTTSEEIETSEASEAPAAPEGTGNLADSLAAWETTLKDYLESGGLSETVPEDQLVNGSVHNPLNEAQTKNIQDIIDSYGPGSIKASDAKKLQDALNAHQAAEISDDQLVQAISEVAQNYAFQSKTAGRLRGAQSGIQVNKGSLIGILRPKDEYYGDPDDLDESDFYMASPEVLENTLNKILEQSLAGADLEALLKETDDENTAQVSQLVADAKNGIRDALEAFNAGDVESMLTSMRSSLDQFTEAISLRNKVHKGDKVVRRLRLRRRALDEVLSAFEGRWPDPVDGGTPQDKHGGYLIDNSVGMPDQNGEMVYPGDIIERTHKAVKGQLGMVVSASNWNSVPRVLAQLDDHQKLYHQGIGNNAFVLSAVGPNNPLYHDPSYPGPRIDDTTGTFGVLEEVQTSYTANQASKGISTEFPGADTSADETPAPSTKAMGTGGTYSVGEEFNVWFGGKDVAGEIAGFGTSEDGKSTVDINLDGVGVATMSMDEFEIAIGNKKPPYNGPLTFQGHSVNDDVDVWINDELVSAKIAGFAGTNGASPTVLLKTSDGQDHVVPVEDLDKSIESASEGSDSNPHVTDLMGEIDVADTAHLVQNLAHKTLKMGTETLGQDGFSNAISSLDEKYKSLTGGHSIYDFLGGKYVYEVPTKPKSPSDFEDIFSEIKHMKGFDEDEYSSLSDAKFDALTNLQEKILDWAGSVKDDEEERFVEFFTGKIDRALESLSNPLSEAAGENLKVEGESVSATLNTLPEGSKIVVPDEWDPSAQTTWTLDSNGFWNSPLGHSVTGAYFEDDPYVVLKSSDEPMSSSLDESIKSAATHDELSAAEISVLKSHLAGDITQEELSALQEMINLKVKSILVSKDTDTATSTSDDSTSSILPDGYSIPPQGSKILFKSSQDAIDSNSTESTGGGPDYAVLQPDGKLVLYADDGFRTEFNEYTSNNPEILGENPYWEPTPNVPPAPNAPAAVPGQSVFQPLPADQKGQDGDMWVTVNGQHKWGRYGAAGVAVMTTDENGKQYVLLGKRGDRDEWYLPGGALDEGESPIQGATREFIEEATEGAEIAEMLELVSTSEYDAGEIENAEGEHWKYTTLIANLPDMVDVTVPPGSNPYELGEYKWVDADELKLLDDQGSLHSAMSNGRFGKLIGFEEGEAEPLQDATLTPENLADVKYDMSGWFNQGGAGGSNGAMRYKDENGNIFYAKPAQSEAHAHNEVLASFLYERMGIAASKTRIGVKNGKTYIVSPEVKGDQNGFPKLQSTPEFLAALQDGFAIDAWLGNYDVIGNSSWNVIADENGMPVRIDAGGALMYRGTGSIKSWWGNTVNELKDMRFGSSKSGSYGNASKVFGTMSDEQVAESAKKLLDITPQDIQEIVSSTGFAPDVQKSMMDTLIKRRHNILKTYNIADQPAMKQLDDAKAFQNTLPAGVGTFNIGQKVKFKGGNGATGVVKTVYPDGMVKVKQDGSTDGFATMAYMGDIEPADIPDAVAEGGRVHLFSKGGKNFAVGDTIHHLDIPSQEWVTGTLNDSGVETGPDGSKFVKFTSAGGVVWDVTTDSIVADDVFNALPPVETYDAPPASIDTSADEWAALGDGFATPPPGSLVLKKQVKSYGTRALVQHPDGSLQIYSNYGSGSGVFVQAYGKSPASYTPEKGWLDFHVQFTEVDPGNPSGKSMDEINDMFESTPSDAPAAPAKSNVEPIGQLDLGTGYATPPLGSKALFKDTTPGGFQSILVEQEDGIHMYWNDGTSGFYANTLPDTISNGSTSASGGTWEKFTTQPKAAATPAAADPAVENADPNAPLSNSGLPVAVGQDVKIIKYAKKNRPKTGVVMKVSPDGAVRIKLLNEDGTTYLNDKGKPVYSIAAAQNIRQIDKPTVSAADLAQNGLPMGLIFSNPDTDNPLYGTEKPAPPVPPAQQMEPAVSDEWVVKADELYKKRKLEKYPNEPNPKGVKDSSYWSTYYAKVLQGSEVDLKWLLDNDYIDQALFDEAKSQQADYLYKQGQLMAVYSKEYEAWQEQFTEWKKAQGGASVIPLAHNDPSVQSWSHGEAWTNMNEQFKDQKISPAASSGANSQKGGGWQEHIRKIAQTVGLKREDIAAQPGVSDHAMGIWDNLSALGGLATNEGVKKPFRAIMTRRYWQFSGPDGKPFDSSSDLSSMKGTIQKEFGAMEMTPGSMEDGGKYGYKGSGYNVAVDLVVPAGIKGVWTGGGQWGFGGKSSEMGFIAESGLAMYIWDVETTNFSLQGTGGGTGNFTHKVKASIIPTELYPYMEYFQGNPDLHDVILPEEAQKIMEQYKMPLGLTEGKISTNPFENTNDGTVGDNQ